VREGVRLGREAAAVRGGRVKYPYIDVRSGRPGRGWPTKLRVGPAQP
jgi:hypothetical protein